MTGLDPALQLAGVGALALIFGWAAYGKLADIDVFRGVLHDYRLLPASWAAPVAWLLPIAEAVGAVGVLWPATRAAAALLLMLLVVVSTAAVMINLARGRTHIDCGCFRSDSRQPIGWRLVVRNAALLFVAAACLIEPSARALVWIDAVSIAFCAIALTLIYVAVPYTDLRLPALRAEPDAADVSNHGGSPS